MLIDPKRELILFLRLSQAFKKRRQMSDRDRALVIGGTCAALMQMKSIASFCRAMILQNNRGHMIGKWETFSDAIEDGDFQTLLRQVRKKLPEDKAHELLEELEYECEVRKESCKTNEEFAAAVLGVDVEWLSENFG